jgi:hypothetical protein
MKMYGRIDEIDVFLTSFTTWKWESASHSCHFTTGEEGPRMLGGPQSQSGRYAEVKILNPTEIWTLTLQSSSL